MSDAQSLELKYTSPFVLRIDLMGIDVRGEETTCLVTAVPLTKFLPTLEYKMYASDQY